MQSDQQIEKAFYSLSEPCKQMEAYIEDQVRSTAPRMILEELFDSKDTICDQIKKELSPKIEQYGFTIENQRHRSSRCCRQEAEAKLVATVMEAEGEKKRRKLQGEGIAEQRLAILNGYKVSIEDFCERLKITPREDVNLTLMSQYMDSIEKMGTSTNTKTIFMPYGPEGASRISDDIRNATLQGRE